MKIEIYSKQNCPFCVKAEAFCKDNALDYKKLILNKDFTRTELFERFPTAKTYPQITIDGQSIGGFNELSNVRL